MVKQMEGYQTILEILSYRAKQTPKQIAYIFLEDGETQTTKITYQELEEKAKKIALNLKSWKGERALLLYPSGLEFISAFFGCLYAGIIAVPAYPPRKNQTLSRLLAILEDSQAKLILTKQKNLTQLKENREEELNSHQLKFIATDNLKNERGDWVIQKTKPNSLAFLQYTSGSTDNPKGVMITHGNLMHNLENIKQAFGHNHKSIGVGWLPLFHDMGLIGHVLQPIYVGFPSILMPPVAFLQKPIRWLKAISQYRATTSGGPNFAYDLCVKKIQPEEIANLDLSSWDLAFNGAEPTRGETLKQFSQKFAARGFNYTAFYPCYGMAETTLFTTGGDKDKKPVIQGVKARELEQNSVVESEISSAESRVFVESEISSAESRVFVESEISSTESRVFVGCGHSYIDTKVIIVNPESLTPCSSKQIGEIWVNSGSVAAGYWNRPEATKQTFQAYLKEGEGPFLRTGDLGFVKNGELFVTGRLKDLIIIRGRNYYPQDIELTVEKSHPSLRGNCTAAFTVEIEGEERLIVACESRTNLHTQVEHRGGD